MDCIPCLSLLAIEGCYVTADGVRGLARGRVTRLKLQDFQLDQATAEALGSLKQLTDLQLLQIHSGPALEASAVSALTVCFYTVITR